MKIPRTILRPIAFAAGLHASGQVRQFLRAHRRTAQVQQRVLMDLVSKHRDTDFGRDHGFATIGDAADFRAAVPVRSYEQMESYFQRVLEGHTTALLPADQPVLMFSRTSGTTGKSKHIPVTPAFLAHMRRGWSVWGLCALRDHPTAWLRPILQVSSPTRETDSPTGLPCGAISGLLAKTQRPIVRRMYCVKPSVCDISDPQAKCYTTLRCAAEHDVAFITTANPSSTIRLIETAQANAERLVRDLHEGTLCPPGHIEPEVARTLRFAPRPRLARTLQRQIERDGMLLPRHLWRVAFLANWTGGTLGLYLPRLRELFDGAVVRDIGLLASEGRFSVPMEDNSAAGVAEILGNFLEFIPADCHDQPNPPTLLAHELEVGAEYFLVVTNWAGLWRYNLDDRVRVTGKLGDSPVIEFLCRGVRTASLTGEKLTERQVVEAMERTCGKLGLAAERFTLQGVFAELPHYRLSVEQADPATAGAMAAALDQMLAELNIEYASKRRSGRLGAIQPRLLEAGTLERTERQLLQARGGRLEQYKHQYLLTDVVTQGPGPATPGQSKDQHG